MNTKHYRQGDVLIISVNIIPAGLKTTKKVILALGEVTGHHHSILTPGVVGYGESEDSLTNYFESEFDMTLTHQEHSPVSIPPGKYESVKQVEYTPKEITYVQD